MSEHHADTPYLTHFKINGLHGDRNLSIDFDRKTKIILSENGSGKTTAMNLLIGVLTGRLRKVNTFEFTNIELGFKSGETIFVTRKDLTLITNSSENISNPRISDVRSSIGDERFQRLIELAAAVGSVRELMAETEFEEADANFIGPSPMFAQELIELAEGFKLSDEQHVRRKYLKDTIKANFPLKVLYLPTYRRVEEDIRQEILGRRGRHSEVDPIINFGMKDVDNLIKSITEDIKGSSISSYQRTSAEMLNQLAVDKLPSAAQIIERLSRANDLNLVLGRLRSIISDEAKEKILGYISNQEILTEGRKTLAFLLSNLITIYDQTKEQDEKIKAFIKVANSYFLDKEFVYDDINVTLQIINTRTKLPLQLERLSSGEKQLVSVLAQLYLRDDGKFAVFFDEPELSLSMEWQRRLLPDILASKKCGFLLAATHSPFLFDNELKHSVEALKVDFFTPIATEKE